jgi:hypothetical protein
METGCILPVVISPLRVGQPAKAAMSASPLVST